MSQLLVPFGMMVGVLSANFGVMIADKYDKNIYVGGGIGTLIGATLYGLSIEILTH